MINYAQLIIKEYLMKMKKLVNAILDFIEFKIIFSHTFYNSSKNDSIDCLISEKKS